MRPTRTFQSDLRAPLNTILGTEASVRLLRLLCTTPARLSGTQLARAATLSGPGAYAALDGLLEAGVVERVGVGARGQFGLNGQHPLAEPLRRLFQAELGRVRGLFGEIKGAVAELKPPPRSVWLYGPVAEGRDRPGDPVQLALVAGSADVGELTEALREPLAELGRQYDVTIELRGLSEPDLEALPPVERTMLGASETLFGLPADAVFSAGRRPKAQPPGRDEHLLELGRGIAARLRRDPTMVPRALERIRARLDVASAGERRELREWETLLRTMSPPRLARFLGDTGPRATRLRQTLPFLDR